MPSYGISIHDPPSHQNAIVVQHEISWKRAIGEIHFLAWQRSRYLILAGEVQSRSNRGGDRTHILSHGNRSSAGIIGHTGGSKYTSDCLCGWLAGQRLLGTCEHTNVLGCSRCHDQNILQVGWKVSQSLQKLKWGRSVEAKWRTDFGQLLKGGIRLRLCDDVVCGRRR